MEGIWTSLSLMGALLSAVSFLSFQTGVTPSADGEALSQPMEIVYVSIVYASLCFNIAGTYLATFFLIMMSYIPLR